MNTAPAKMWVFVGERFACIKISGRANFTSSIDFKTVVTELLESLGVLHLFKLAEGPAQVPDTAQPQALTPACPTKEEVTRSCLEAHQTLMKLNPENAAKFKEVAAFLAEDLKK